jgi:2-phospho-L-lactate guanylyltransferase
LSRTLAVIPFRGRPSAKSRLSTLFSAQQRELIACRVLDHVLTVIGESGAVDHILVVTSDDEAPVIPLGLVRQTTVLQQPPGCVGLNAAIGFGRDWAVSQQYEAMLIVLPDLPMLKVGDVRSMVRDDAAVVLAPDRHGAGTNALSLHLGQMLRHRRQPFRFGFGDKSARNHVAEAKRLGIDPVTIVATGLQHDLDTPED